MLPMAELAVVELLTKKVTSLNIDLCMNRYSVTLEISGNTLLTAIHISVGSAKVHAHFAD